MEGEGTSKDFGIRDNYEAINWTPLRSAVLHNFYDLAPLSMQCNQSNGGRFPGNWEGMPQTLIQTPLQTSKDECNQ